MREGVPPQPALSRSELVMPLSLYDAGDIPAPPSRLSAELIELLQALNIEMIAFALNGGGDTGETTVEEVRFRDGQMGQSIPALPIAITDLGNVATLDIDLSNIAADAPEGDWVNNEGGYGTVTIHPFDPDPHERLGCDMTYRDDDPEDEDNEDWDQSMSAFDLAAPAADESTDTPVTIIGEVQP